MHINPLNFIVENLALGPHLNVREVNELKQEEDKEHRYWEEIRVYHVRGCLKEYLKLS